MQKWLTHKNKNENEIIDDLLRDDSVSNVASKHSSRQSSGSRKSSSSTASARIKAKAERAALVARAAALKEKHMLEEQEQQLRRRRKQLELEAELAASTAKLAILNAAGQQKCIQTPIRWHEFLPGKENGIQLQNLSTPWQRSIFQETHLGAEMSQQQCKMIHSHWAHVPRKQVNNSQLNQARMLMSTQATNMSLMCMKQHNIHSLFLRCNHYWISHNLCNRKPKRKLLEASTT